MNFKNQSYLPGFKELSRGPCHGGDESRGKRKIARPLDPKQALHVVMHSEVARGKLSMLQPKHAHAVHEFTYRLAERWGVRVYRFANVGNHLHLLVKIPSRAVWRRFSRQLAGGIAQIVTGARKGMALEKNETGRAFWDGLAFTRIVYFGRDFKNLGTYLIKNLFEAMGVPMKRLLAQGVKILTVSEDGRIHGLPG